MDKKYFVDIEHSIIKKWQHIKAFEHSLRLSKKFQPYVFYDGPPFATGLPHYGHVLVSFIKDIVARYMTQTGKYVERRWGWDTHGLPIEYEIEKKLGIKTKQQILDYGIDKYNDACRKIILMYASEWEKTMNRLGRWVDFKHGYKTMDRNFMESVWWVFKTLHTKGLVYQSNRVMPYSSSCSTPLSNFEASDNYKRVSDPSLYFKVKININRIDAKMLVWTTTPWSIPGNIAICVNPTATYCLINNGGEKLIMAQDLIETFEFSLDQVTKTWSGTELVGYSYVPVFELYNHEFTEGFKIVADDYVKTDAGTGIVHIAPAFGVDDQRICMQNSIIDKFTELPCPFDANCNFSEKLETILPEIVGMNFKTADKLIINHLKSQNLVFKQETINHEYPFCWRSDTPLMYRSVSSWFINVDKIRQKCLDNVDQTFWIPRNVKNRFVNWIAGNGTNTVDWCVSRNRFWGTPLPIWTNGNETVIIGSVEELEQQAGLEKGSLVDLHRDHIDDIEIPSSLGGKPLRRVEEVFDCWFESGSMPYGSVHYPFSMSAEQFAESYFPAEFIAEGLDQTRGWFYTLNILSTALFDQPAFKNVIVNGILLNKKGERMSKRKRNYPDPNLVIEKYGADAVRLYLTKAKCVRGEEFKFNDADIKIIPQTIFIPLHNCVNLLIESTIDLSSGAGDGSPFKPIALSRKSSFQNPLDNWILQELDNLLVKYHREMKKYKLYRIVECFTEFIDKLSRWYINLNKKRIKKADKKSLSVLYHCLYNFCLVLAPFAPFYAEHIYGQLGIYDPLNSAKSVHWLQIPNKVWHHNQHFLDTVKNLFSVIELTRTFRSNTRIPFQKPIINLTVLHSDPEILSDLSKVDKYLSQSCNILNINYSKEISKYSQIEVLPVFQQLRNKYGKYLKQIKQQLEKVTYQQITDLKKSIIDHITVIMNDGLEIALKLDDLKIRTKTTGHGGALSNDNFMILADTTQDAKTEIMYQCRRLTAFINKMRASVGLKSRDHILVYYRINNSLTDCTKQANNLDNVCKIFTDQEKHLLPVLNYKIHTYIPGTPIFYQKDIDLFDINVLILFSEITKSAPPVRAVDEMNIN